MSRNGLLTTSPGVGTMFVLCCFVLLCFRESEGAFLSSNENGRSSIAHYATRDRSKLKGKVIYDPTTGFYRPMRKEEREAVDIAQNAGKQIDPKTWDSFKSFVYQGIDGVSAVPEKLKVVSSKDSHEESILVGGYRDTVKNSHLKRLMVKEQTKSVKEPTQTVKPAAFDLFKGAVYNTVDLAKAKKSKSAPAQPDVEKVREVFSPSWNSNDSKLERQRRKEALERAKRAASVKESVYDVSDNAVTVVKGLFELPSQLVSLAEKVARFIMTLPVWIRDMIDSLLELPTTVQSSTTELQKSMKTQVENAQQSFQTTLERTQNTVHEIQEIPSLVMESAEKTKSNAKAVKVAIDESLHQGKVLFGLEDPKPRPPKIPPPGVTVQQKTPPLTAMSIVGGMVKGVGQAAWWVTKTTAVVALDIITSIASKEPVEEATPVGTAAAPTEDPSHAPKPFYASSAVAVETPPKPVVQEKTEEKKEDAVQLDGATKTNGEVNSNSAAHSPAKAEVKLNGATKTIVDNVSATSGVAEKQEQGKSKKDDIVLDDRKPAKFDHGTNVEIVRKKAKGFSVKKPDVVSSKKDNFSNGKVADPTVLLKKETQEEKRITEADFEDINKQVSDALKLAEAALKFADETK